MSALDRWATPVARKTHACSQCYRRIEIGERYDYWTGLNDDGWFSSRTCEQCQRLVSDLWAIDWRDEDPCGGGDCYIYLPLRDDLADLDDDPLWAARLAGWRAQWATPDGQRIAYPEVTTEVTA